MARKRNPDNIHVANLHGQALRHAELRTPTNEAIADLTMLAAGRSDLLAEAAATILGGYLAAPGTKHPKVMTAAALLIEAGADPDLVVGMTDAVRDRMERLG